MWAVEIRAEYTGKQEVKQAGRELGIGGHLFSPGFGWARSPIDTTQSLIHSSFETTQSGLNQTILLDQVKCLKIFIDLFLTVFFCAHVCYVYVCGVQACI